MFGGDHITPTVVGHKVILVGWVVRELGMIERVAVGGNVLGVFVTPV